MISLRPIQRYRCPAQNCTSFAAELSLASGASDASGIDSQGQMNNLAVAWQTMGASLLLSLEPPIDSRFQAAHTAFSRQQLGETS